MLGVRSSAGEYSAYTIHLLLRNFSSFIVSPWICSCLLLVYDAALLSQRWTTDPTSFLHAVFGSCQGLWICNWFSPANAKLPVVNKIKHVHFSSQLSLPCARAKHAHNLSVRNCVLCARLFSLDYHFPAP